MAMTYASYSSRSFDDGYVDDDEGILSQMSEIYNETAAVTQTRWLQQSIDERFYAGDQSLWNELYISIPVHQRKQFSFNKIKRIVNMIAGYQRKNRKTLNVIPIENSDMQTADQFSKLLVWANSQCNAMNILADAFLGALITGMNLLCVWMDKRYDPYSGDIRIDNMSYNGYMIDPYFKKMDLSDCNYVWTRKYMSKEQIISLMPERRKEIEQMRPAGTKDRFFNFLPENYTPRMVNLIPYDEYWYQDMRKSIILLDAKNEESIEWQGDDENLRMFLKMHPTIRKRDILKPTVKMAVVINNRVMYNGKNPFGIDKYPFVPVTAYYQPELPYYEWRIQGVVRSLRDAQFILNRRQQILLDTLESQINSGLKVMAGSLLDDKDAYKSGQGQVLFIKKNAPLGMQSVEKIPPADVSPAFMNVIQQMNTDIMEISGVNEELLGSAEDDKAGILSMLRQGAGLTTLQILFDHLDESMKNLGRLELELMQANFSLSKVKRVIEEEPTEQFSNKTFLKFDCEVVEGADTPTQKITAFKQALYLKEIGIPIPTEHLLEMATFQNKKDVIQKIQAQEQQQAQMQQMQMQMQMQELQARANLANSRADKDKSSTVSNISLGIERRMEAIKDLNQSELDKIRSIKELQGMDLEHIEKAILILQALKQQEVKQVDQIKSQIDTPEISSNSSLGG